MKKILVRLIFVSMLAIPFLVSTGCTEDPSTLPSYIKIDTILVDSTSYDSTGSTAHQIRFAWLYINDNIQGVYLLPCNVPIIGEGPVDIQVFGGVYEFGNGDNATRYIFYDPWKTTDTLKVEDTLTLNPHVRYNVGLKVQYNEDFDNAGSLTLDKHAGGGSYSHSSPVDVYEGAGSGFLSLNQGENESLVVKSELPINVPKNKLGYFLELNYKCNSVFFLDIETSSGSRPIIGFNKKETWNKAYINITHAIDVTPGEDVSLIFTVPQDSTVVTQEVFIDNLKLIYQE